MICPSLAVNQNVVKENKDEASQVVPKYVVHEGLECCRGVALHERHPQELIQAVVGAERRLVVVIGPHLHLVVA